MVFNRKLFDEGYELRKSEQFSDALAVLAHASEQAAVANEWSWRDAAYVLRAMTLRDLNRLPDTIEVCHQMLRLEPSTAQQAAHFYLSSSLIAAGDLNGGFTNGQAFIRLLPTSTFSKTVTWYHLQSTFLLDRDRQRLIEDFGRAIAANADNATAYFCCAVIKQANLSDEAGAYADYEQAFTLATDDADIQQWAQKLRADAQTYFGSVSASQPKRFQPGIQYCSLTTWHPGEGDPGLQVDIYGQGIEHRSRLVDDSPEVFEARLLAKGWEFKTTRSSRSGTTRYYQRRVK